MKNKLKFVDGTTLVADRTDDVLIMKRHGGHLLIKDVLYISGIKCNLLSIVQLFEKSFKIHMENKVLHVMDTNMVLILKTSMTINRTFKIESEVIEYKYLTTMTS